MEENNRKGPGVFYAVVGVATLVVAIIGATFAYFSASAEASKDSDDIEGGTNTNLASALNLDIYKVSWSDAEAASNDLVPASFDNSTTAADITGKQIQGALNAKCVNAGYTGCHLWKIEANSLQDISNVNIWLDLTVTAEVTSNWRYAIFTSTSAFSAGKSDLTITAADPIFQGSIGTGISELDIHKNASMTTGTIATAPSNTYYLLVYLANTGSSQNEETNSETGTYEGTVTMEALGGEVKASFTAVA